jgi:hypothetical protein
MVERAFPLRRKCGSSKLYWWCWRNTEAKGLLRRQGTGGGTHKNRIGKEESTTRSALSFDISVCLAIISTCLIRPVHLSHRPSSYRHRQASASSSSTPRSPSQWLLNVPMTQLAEREKHLTAQHTSASILEHCSFSKSSRRRCLNASLVSARSPQVEVVFEGLKPMYDRPTSASWS